MNKNDLWNKVKDIGLVAAELSATYIEESAHSVARTKNISEEKRENAKRIESDFAQIKSVIQDYRRNEKYDFKEDEEYWEYTEQSFETNTVKDMDNGMILAQESILMQYGYNVSQIEGLPKKQEEKY